jgi:hypothetical protein
VALGCGFPLGCSHDPKQVRNNYFGFSPVACQQNPIKINCTSFVFLLRMGKEEREDKDNKTKGFHISVQIKLYEFKCKEEREDKDKRRGVYIYVQIKLSEFK